MLNKSRFLVTIIYYSNKTLLLFCHFQDRSETFERDTLLRNTNNENGTNEVGNGAEVTRNDIVQNGKKKTEGKHKVASCMQKINEFFDLDLLRDGVYLNVIIGLSLYYVAESNFKLMTPFFLSNIGK